MKKVLILSSLLCICIRLTCQNINYDNLASVNPLFSGEYNSGAPIEGQYYPGHQNVYSSYGIGNTENGYGYLSNNRNEKNLNEIKGYKSLLMSISKNNNMPIGYISSSSNLNIGCQSLANINNGIKNTAIGYSTLTNTTDGNYNTALGYQSQGTNITGTGNTTIGYLTDVYSSNQSNSTAIGNGAVSMTSNEMRLGNSQISSLYCMGATATTTSTPNMYVDPNTGQIMMSSTSNSTNIILIGDLSGTLTGGTNYVSVIGLNNNPISGTSPSTGQALIWNGTAWAPGTISTTITLSGDVSGTYISGIGSTTVTGLYNQPISSTTPTISQALIYNGTSWSPATLAITADATMNNVAIGYNATPSSSYEVRLGNNSITTLYCKGATSSLSSGSLQQLYVDMNTGQIGYSISSSRYKENIKDLEINTNKLYELRPVSFNYKKDEVNREAGLIAEEVDKVLPYLVVYRKAKDVIPGNTSDDLIPESVHYEKLPVLMLSELQKHEKEIKSLINENQQLKQENNQYKEKIQKIENRINEIEMLLQNKRRK